MSFLHKHLPLFFFSILLMGIIGVYIMRLKFILDHQYLIDDSFIYLRFARNFVYGLGFVWNPGEHPVEGFTSILYIGLLILVEKTGLPLISALPILSTVFTMSIFILNWHLGKVLNSDHKIYNLLFTTNLLALSPILLNWSSTGMEMPLYTALLIISVLGYLGYQHQKISAQMVGFIFAITTLSRPEGLVIFGATLIFDFVTSFFQHKELRYKEYLVMAVAFGIVYAPIFIWKWIYFGYPFPNTYYDKTDGISFVQVIGGLKYLAEGLRYILPTLGIPLLFLLFDIKKIERKRNLNIEKLYVTVIIATSLGIVALNGGDHFVFGRFLMPALPLLVTLIITCYLSFLDNLHQIYPIRFVFLLIPIAVALFFAQPWSFISPDYERTQLPPANSNKLECFYSLDAGFIAMGKTLRNIASENTSVAVVPVGAIGYYCNCKVIDMVGLVDSFIAHEPFDPHYTATWRPGHDKGDGAYVLSQHPDYIQLTNFLTSQPLPGLNEHAQQYKSIVEIWESAEFHSAYEFYPIRIENGWYYNLYRRIDNNKTEQKVP